MLHSFRARPSCPRTAPGARGAVRGCTVSYRGVQNGYSSAAPYVAARDTRDGSLRWQTSLATAVDGSPAVAPDGTIYIAGNGELFALWGKDAPLSEGWPTEGGGMGRLRRAR